MDPLSLVSMTASLLLLGGIIGLVKTILIAVLAILNGILAMLAAVTVWKSYLVIGVKVLLTAMVVIPVLGILAYFIWAHQKVAAAS